MTERIRAAGVQGLTTQLSDETSNWIVPGLSVSGESDTLAGCAVGESETSSSSGSSTWSFSDGGVDFDESVVTGGQVVSSYRWAGCWPIAGL